MVYRKNSLCRLVFLPVLLSFLFLLPEARAQRERRFEAGVVAGLTASQIDGDRSYGYNKLGLQGGIRTAVLLGEKTSASLEMLFAQRGAQSEFIKDNYSINFFSLTLNYVELPIQFHLRDWKVEDDEGEYYKISLNAGISYARLINTSSNDDLSAVNVVTPFLNKNDFNYLIGATLMANRHWGFNFRVVRGIGFLYNPSEWDNPPADKKWYSHSLYFQTMYMF